MLIEAALHISRVLFDVRESIVCITDVIVGLEISVATLFWIPSDSLQVDYLGINHGVTSM